MLTSLNLLKIHTDDIEVQRKGSLLQALVVVLISLTLFLIVFEMVRPEKISLQSVILKDSRPAY